MLRIDIPSDGHARLTFAELQKYELPAPPFGFDTEIHDAVVIQFEDEQQAIDYAHELDEYAESIRDQNSAETRVVSDIIKAISDDEFVQAYIQS